MATDLSLDRLLGPDGAGYEQTMRAALDYLQSHSEAQLLERVGQTIEAVPSFKHLGKHSLQDSYGGAQTGPSDDLLAGLGMFYITERRRLCLDLTSGHYQMTWGYNPPEVCEALAKATASGVVWDNHSNLPQAPVKALANTLTRVANDPGAPDSLDTVLLGVCTGSVACEAALKIQLICFERRRGPAAVPVLIALDGNYHGTGFFTQRWRGMWERYIHNIEVVLVEPNDAEGLEEAFRRHGANVAGFWAEPIMMNREAIPVDGEYLRLARRLCDESGALMCIDEIQTGFWQPEVFAYRSLGFAPDLVICGKGMTAGFHPLSAVIYKARLDVLSQYDAISTNGTAALAGVAGLCCIAMIEGRRERLARTGDRFQQGMSDLAAEFPELLANAHGKRHMMGLKFRRVEDALAFHKQAVADGFWVRAHAYHAGHSTVLAKLGLCADEPIVDFVLGGLRARLEAFAPAARV